MADSLGNLNMSDMKWIGEPLDVVGQYQKGVNLAEQGQRMKQSAEMHPLKMEDTKARTSLVKQQGEYNLRTMDSRVGLSDSMARLKETAASISENTQGAQEDIIQARGMQDMVNAQVAEATILSKTDATRSTNLMAVQRQQLHLDTTAAQIRNTRAVADINHSNAYVAQQTQDNKIRMSGIQVGAAGREAEIHKRNLDDYNSQLPNMQIELNAISNMSYADLKDYEIPSDISHATHRAEIERHLAQRRGTDAHADYQQKINQANNLHQQQLTRQLGVQNKLNATTRTILELKDTYGNSLFRNVDSGTLNQAGEAMLDKLEASSAVYDKLSAANKEEIRAAMHGYRGMSLFPTGQGETLTGQYGADYNGQLILDAKGIAKAKEMLVGQERAALKSYADHAGQVLGMVPHEIDKDGNMTFTRGAPLRKEMIPHVIKRIAERTADKIAANEAEGITRPLTQAENLAIRSGAIKDVATGGLPFVVTGGDLTSQGVGPGGVPYVGPDGKVQQTPTVTTPTTGTPGAALPAGKTPGGPPATTGTFDPAKPPAHAWDNREATGGNDDVMLGNGGYSVEEFLREQDNELGAGPDAAAMWKNRAEVFKDAKGMLKGSDSQRAVDARLMTRLAIKSKWKTGGVARYIFQDDYDYNSKPSKLLAQTRRHAQVTEAELLDSINSELYGADNEDLTTKQMWRLHDAVKAHPGDHTKWPKFEGELAPTGPDWLFSTTDTEYSASKRAVIKRKIAAWGSWNKFNARLKKASP